MHSSNLFSSNKPSRDIISPDQVLDKLTNVLGASNVQADPEKNEHYRMGWRSGGGAALAVLFPQTLLDIWRSLEVCVEGN
ncbi:D-lactate dehydrogenase, partial [Psychrobacter sp. AOP1-A1-60]